MTEMLQRAITEIEKLPPEAQDAIAAQILADLEEEQAWAVRFAATTGVQWDAMVADVQHAITAGGTTPLEDVPQAESVDP